MVLKLRPCNDRVRFRLRALAPSPHDSRVPAPTGKQPLTILIYFLPRRGFSESTSIDRHVLSKYNILWFEDSCCRALPKADWVGWASFLTH